MLGKDLELFGINFMGVNAVTGQKLLLTLGLIVVAAVLRYAFNGLSRLLLRGRQNEHVRFWTRQGVNLLVTAFLILGLVSVWFDNPERLATAFGLVAAGLAFALQQVVTSIAGYFVILRGNNFTVGDRISMGGVRGDVIALGFIQTTILEMGQPPALQSADPAVWVRSRQFTGRIVTVSNAQLFNEPVFNYTRDFPYIWEEITLPVRYQDARDRVEQILLTAARRHALQVEELDKEDLRRMQERYAVQISDIDPQVFYRLTDNWLELTVRFLANTHGVRGVKDALSRDILAGLDAAGIGLASATYDIVGFPKVQIAVERSNGDT